VEKGQVHPGRDLLYPGKTDLKQAVVTCLSSPFESEFFVDWAPSQIDSRRGTRDILVQHKRDVGTATVQIPADCPLLFIYA